jgi:hypothetical protein
MGTGIAAHAGEAVVQDAALEELVGYLTDYGAPVTVGVLEALLVDGVELGEVILDEAEERRRLRAAGLIDAGSGARAAARGTTGSCEREGRWGRSCGRTGASRGRWSRGPSLGGGDIASSNDCARYQNNARATASGLGVAAFSALEARLLSAGTNGLLRHGVRLPHGRRHRADDDGRGGVRDDGRVPVYLRMPDGNETLIPTRAGAETCGSEHTCTGSACHTCPPMDICGGNTCGSACPPTLACCD